MLSTDDSVDEMKLPGGMKQSCSISSESKAVDIVPEGTGMRLPLLTGSSSLSALELASTSSWLSID